MDIYYHIAGNGEGKLTEKMSRFLAFAVHIQSAEDAKTIIKEFQNRFHDARHVCWAYMCGPEMTEFQLNDNGEPSGTAGKPILGQIRSAGVTDVIVLVVRYFGGIKLGTSGLIAAYREAARLALDDAGKIRVYKKTEAVVEVSYIALDQVMRIVKEEEGIELLESNFDNLCRLRLLLRDDCKDNIISKLTKAEGAMLSFPESDVPITS